MKIIRQITAPTATYRYIFCMLMLPQYALYFQAANFVLLIPGLIIGASILSSELWDKKFSNQTMVIYWGLSLFFCLPLSSAYMLFHSYYQISWVINGITSIAALMLFVDLINATFMIAAAAITGYAAHLLCASTTPAIEAYTHACLSAASVFIAYRFIDLRSAEIAKTARFIAHQTKSSIAATSMLSSTMLSVMKDAGVSNDETPTIEVNKDDWLMLRTSAENMIKSSRRGIRIIETILHSYQEEYHDIGRYSLAACVKGAILNHTYLTAQEMKKINFNHEFKSDIIFYGSKNAMESAISHLISDIFKYSKLFSELAVSINGLKLSFQDNSNPKIIYKHSLGIKHCQHIMKVLGGDAAYKNTLEGYPSFVLTFPDHDC